MVYIYLLSNFHTRRGHNEQLVELDNKFHELIYKASGSKMLEHMLSDFHHYEKRVRKITLAMLSRATKSSQEYAAILDAIRKLDGDLAEALAHEHIMNTNKNISEQGL